MTTLERFKVERPDIAITISWDYAPYYEWNGDGEDPTNDGYKPHSVEVKASKIVGGNLIYGCAYLGGCYSKNGGKDDPEIGGYLPQMIESAIGEVDL